MQKIKELNEKNWNWAIIGSRAKGEWPDYVPGGKKLLTHLSEVKKLNSDLAVNLEQSFLNGAIYISDNFTDKTKSGGTLLNEKGRARRRMMEKQSRGLGYFLAHPDTDWSTLTAQQCIHKGEELEKANKSKKTSR